MYVLCCIVSPQALALPQAREVLVQTNCVRVQVDQVLYTSSEITQEGSASSRARSLCNLRHLLQHTP